MGLSVCYEFERKKLLTVTLQLLQSVGNAFAELLRSARYAGSRLHVMCEA